MSQFLQWMGPAVLISVAAFTVMRRNRERASNARLRSMIQAQVRFETVLYRACILRTAGFGALLGWIPLQGPKRLVVGTDAVMVSTPLAFREFAFAGRDCSIAVTRMPPPRLLGRELDWIVITGPAGGRRIQLAITQENLPDIWQALAATGAAAEGGEPPAGLVTGPSAPPVRYRTYALGRLATALVIILLADAAVWLVAIALPWLANLGDVGAIVAVIMFGSWIYRARVNADGHGWPQRRSPGSAIWSWFVPVVNLFFPFQIMADIWRAGLPAETRPSRATLPGMWWTSWLAFFLLSAFTTGPASPPRYVVLFIQLTGVLTEIMTAVLVQKVSGGPLGQRSEPADQPWVAKP